MKRTSRLARRYAAALMALAEEAGSSDAVAADLETVGRALETSRELRLLVASPVVRPAKKQAVFRELFGGRLGNEVRTFLDLLVAKGRERHLPDVITEYAALRDARQGVVTAHATTAVALDADQENQLRGRLEKLTGRSVRLLLANDPSIRGGVIVRIGDTVHDGSVNRQLEVLRERWSGGAVTVQ